MQLENLHKIFLQSNGICTDTRKIKFNTIFFALRGKKFNGNKFADQALLNGCSFCVVDEKKYVSNEKSCSCK